MATECTQDSVLRFLSERGGKVSNAELIDHFKPFLSGGPPEKAAARDMFKGFVDNVGFVKQENGAKYVVLRKKYRDSVQRRAGEVEDRVPGQGDREPRRDGPVGARRSCEMHADTCSAPDAEPRLKPAADVNQSASPGSGYRAVNRDAGGGRAARNREADNNSTSAAFGQAAAPAVSPTGPSVPKLVVSEEREMGNAETARAGKDGTSGRYPSKKNKGKAPDMRIPHIAVTGPSPLPAADEETVFSLPVPEISGAQNAQSFGQGNASSSWPARRHSTGGGRGSLTEVDQVKDLAPRAHQEAAKDGKACPNGGEGHVDPGAGQELPSTQATSRRRASRGSQRGLLSSHPSDDGADEGQPCDTISASGSDCNTPKSSRKNFIELMMSSSPQLRRSMVHKNPGSLLARHRDSVRSDSDSASLVSSVDEDSGSVSLDPLEHEWMMCASDGQWESLHRLLACDPNLVAKKDFVTGFTCLHWAAKQGKQELMALLVNFAKQHAVPLNINCRSSAGYTPLHLAAMHDHVEVVKLLVGAYDADVEARDYSGKKPWQYLGGGVDEDIKEIVGASGDSDAENADIGAGRWRLSKVLPSNLMPLKLLNLPEEDVCDVGGPGKAKSVHRKTSMSRIKPRLHKIRFKTQIIHSTSLRETEEGELALKSPGKSRPKSTLFG
nr:PREDICTED: ankyrin repeat domain-containing protein SOWAHC [Lepisosteus oculatus]